MNEQLAILIFRLREGELSTQRFLKVGKPGCEPDKDKAAFETEWEKHLYGPEDLDSFPRWGICGKDLLVLIDSDKRELYDYLSRVLPNTFEVTSPRHGLPHKYLIVCGEQVPNGVFHIPGDLDEKGRKNKCGEVRAQNQYLVTCGTTIRYQDLQTGEWKTGEYTITNNVPIARMEHADFMAAIKPYMDPEDDSQKLTAEDIAYGVSTGERHNKASRYADHLIGHRKLDAKTALYELRDWNQKLNNPPINDDEYLKRCVDDAISFLSKKTGISKEQLAINGAIANPVSGYVTSNLDKYFEEDKHGNKHFLPIVFAKDLLQNYTFKTTRDNETAYCFNAATGIYEANGETIVKEEMAKILDESTRQHYYADILFYVKAKTYFDRPTEHPNKLVLSNGILNMETYELEPFSDKEFLQIHVPRTYDPKLGCPLIQQFILEVVGEAQVPLLQEWIGYCLYAKYPIHKAMILLGPGANGKSTLINLIDRFLGERNKASITLQALCSNRFAASSLDGKLVNLCADIPNKALVQTGMFKMLVGADSIPAERKFKDAYTFDNIAKLMFSTNEIPKTTDDTIAYFRRWIIINCTNYFPPSKAKTRILDDICTPNEFGGLLNWALIGLKRLLKNGQFSDNRTWEQERERYLASSNSALAFIEGHINPSQKERDRVTKEELYTTYVKYCRKNDLLIMRQADLTLNMRQAIPDAKEVQFRRGKDRKKGWAYVTVTAVTASLLNTTTPCLQSVVLSGTEVTAVTPKRNDGKLEEAMGHKSTSDIEKVCVLCLKPLWSTDTTFYQGKLAHCVCVAKLTGQVGQP
jgi:putative DNA primase/helicase